MLQYDDFWHFLPTLCFQEAIRKHPWLQGTLPIKNETVFWRFLPLLCSEEAKWKHPKLHSTLSVIIVFISNFHDLQTDHDQVFPNTKRL